VERDGSSDGGSRFPGRHHCGAIALLALFRAVFHLVGSGFFDRFPLFPFTFPAAVLVQLCAKRYDFEWAVNRRAVEGLGGIAIDGVIICAVGTLSLGAIGANVGPLIILAAAAIGWSVFVTLVIGRASSGSIGSSIPFPSLANLRACSPAAS